MIGHVLTANAPAKVNLHLELLARRDDGFHDIETVIATVGLCDTVSLTTGSLTTGSSPTGNEQASSANRQIQILFDPHSGFDQEVPADHRNLAVQALQKFRERAGIEQPARIELVKRIPSQAGLGGASSDAATVLRLANRLWQVQWPHSRLVEIAAELGSDVPFFLGNSCSLCEGRGEKVSKIPNRLRPWLVLVKPPIGFPTGQVYSLAEVPAVPTGSTALRSALAGGSLAALGRSLFNRLESAAGRFNEWVDRLKFEYSRLGCCGHQLTGSGSTYFGIFNNRLTAKRSARVLESRLTSCRVFCHQLLPFQSTRQSP